MSENNFPISSEVLCLKKVLAGGPYKIPSYQRPYEWTEKNIDDMLYSIDEAFLPDKNPVFFGTMQLNSPKEGGKQIVDGQQRLTTFILLLSVINEIIGSDSCELKGIIQKNGDERFEKAIMETTDKISGIDDIYCNNKTLIYKKLCEEKSTQKSIADLKVMKDFILDKVYFVMLNTSELPLSDIISVFRTINTTGLDLNDADVFKVKYYDYLNEKYPKPWDWMEKINACYQYVEDSNIARKPYHTKIEMTWVLDVYKHSICAEEGYGFDSLSLSNERFFEKVFCEKKKILSFEYFESLVKEFVRFYKWIEERKNADFQNFPMEVFSVELVEKTRYSRYWTIPFIMVFFATKENEISIEERERLYIDALKINLESFKLFTVYSVVNDRVINAMQTTVCKSILPELKKRDTTSASLSELLWKDIYYSDPRGRFIDLLEKGLIYNGSRAHLICVLSALIDEVESGNGNKTIGDKLFNWKNYPFDIEHILAQNKFSDFDEEEKMECNGIGNLVVLERKINRGIKDNDVSEKVAIGSKKDTSYQDSKYSSIEKFLYKWNETQTWNVKLIRARAESEIEKIMSFMESNQEKVENSQ